MKMSVRKTDKKRPFYHSSLWRKKKEKKRSEWKDGDKMSG